MPDGLNAKITGVAELNQKLGLLKSNFDGKPVQALCRDSLKPIMSQAKSNARRGPTGRVVRGIKIYAGRKAMKYGAAAVLKVAWKFSGAILEEWGRRDGITPADTRRPGMGAFRIPLAKLGAFTRGASRAGGIRSGKRTQLSGSFGFAFVKKLKGMAGSHFFQRAVEQKLPETQKTFETGCQKIIQDSIR